MGLFTRSHAAAILTAGCCLSIPAVSVIADPFQTAPSTPAATPATPAPDLSDGKLDAAAAAVKRIATLQQDYRQRIADADLPADKERIVTEAKNEMAKAITEQGISVQEYVAILDAAYGNPEIRDKIIQRIRPADKTD